MSGAPTRRGQPLVDRARPEPGARSHTTRGGARSPTCRAGRHDPADRLRRRQVGRAASLRTRHPHGGRHPRYRPRTASTRSTADTSSCGSSSTAGRYRRPIAWYRPGASGGIPSDPQNQPVHRALLWASARTDAANGVGDAFGDRIEPTAAVTPERRLPKAVRPLEA